MKHNKICNNCFHGMFASVHPKILWRCTKCECIRHMSADESKYFKELINKHNKRNPGHE